MCIPDVMAYHYENSCDVAALPNPPRHLAESDRLFVSVYTTSVYGSCVSDWFHTHTTAFSFC